MQHSDAVAVRRPTWTPAPAIWISFCIHAVAFLSSLAFPATLRWALVGIAGNHLFLAAAAFFPRSCMLGPNLGRLPEFRARRGEVALTFDDGPDPRITPQVLDILDRYDAKASFFCIGKVAAAHAPLVREIIRRGHSVENHTYRHPNAFALYGLRAMRGEVESAQSILHSISGRVPRFFRAPLGVRSPLLDPILARTGLRHVTWTRRGYDGVSGDAIAVLRRLSRGLAAGDVLVLHDGRSALTQAGEPVVLCVLPPLLEELRARRLKAVSLTAAFDEDPHDRRIFAADLLESSENGGSGQAQNAD